jgi:hypothetical protein
MNQGQIENVFLAFANYSFRANPDNLRKVFHEIEQHFYTDEKEFTRARALVGLIITLAKIKNPVSASEHTKKILPPELNFFQQSAINTAFEAIYGYRDNYCESSCFYNGRKKRWDYDIFTGPMRMNCLECEQLEFVEILEQIINGHDYLEIDEFKSLIMSSYDCIKTIVNLFDSGGKTDIKETIVLQFPAAIGMGASTVKGAFAGYLRNIMAYSLGKFLMQRQNNRLRLKQCAWCGKFDVSGKARPRINPKTKEPFLAFCSGASCKDHYYRDRRKEEKYGTAYVRGDRSE